MEGLTETTLTNKNRLDYYKRLNLVQLAKDLYAYKIDTKGSYSQNDHQLESVYKHYTYLKMYQSALVGRDDSQANVILVRKNTEGAYFYTNVTVPGDEGTIIDFIAHRNQLDLKNEQDLAKIVEIISSYIGEAVPAAALSYIPEKQELQDRNAQVARYFKLLPEFSHPEYLLSRGIEKRVLDAAEFKGRICNSVFKDKKGNQHINIAFPVVDKEDNLCGVEYKNISQSGLQAESNSVLWRSNLVNPDKSVEAFVIGESAIDLISYAQIKEVIGKNFLFITHAGDLNKTQIRAIQYLVDQHSPKRLILTEKKDISGYQYDIMLVGALNKPANGALEIENDFRAELNIINKVKAELVLSFSFSTFKEGEVLGNKILADFSKHNHDPSQPIFNTGPGAITYGKHSASISIEYQISKLNMQKALEIVAHYRGMGDFITIDKPNGANTAGNQVQDWNELLMTDMEISYEDIPGLMYDFKNANAEENKISKSPVLKPVELVQLFIENWDKGISDVQEEAVNAGVSIDVISYMIAKHQLIAFNNFIEAVQRVYDLDFVGFREFEEFKSFIADNEDRFKEIVVSKKLELQHLENDLTIVKKQLKTEGDELQITEYQELMEKKSSLESSVKVSRKAVGTYNEYLDAKYFNELTEIVSAKAKKVWDKTVRESMSDFRMVNI